MTEQEGVTKYELHFRASAPLVPESVAALNTWRTRLCELGLIGQHPARYGGAGFGNLSCRLDAGATRFAVTGTQTGNIARLDERHYAIVTECDALNNRLRAEGPIAPSSESLTHGQLYALDRRINAVFHVHAPALWRAAARLGIPLTRARVAYGTPAMVAEVERLFRETAAPRLGIFAMGGHEDGVVSFGPTVDVAGDVLLRFLDQSNAVPSGAG